MGDSHLQRGNVGQNAHQLDGSGAIQPTFCSGTKHPPGREKMGDSHPYCSSFTALAIAWTPKSISFSEITSGGRSRSTVGPAGRAITP